jgi:hypothetical protein
MEIYWSKNHIYTAKIHAKRIAVAANIYLSAAKMVYYKYILATDNILTGRII